MASVLSVALFPLSPETEIRHLGNLTLAPLWVFIMHSAWLPALDPPMWNGVEDPLPRQAWTTVIRVGLHPLALTARIAFLLYHYKL